MTVLGTSCEMVLIISAEQERGSDERVRCQPQGRAGTWWLGEEGDARAGGPMRA